MNNQGNTPEKKEQQTGKAKKKRSLFKTQMRVLITLAAVAVLIGIAAGLTVHYFESQSVYLDTFEESRKTPDGEKIKYTYYSIKKDGELLIVDGEEQTLPNYYVDEDGNVTTDEENGTHIFQTEIGSMLLLTDSGSISYFATVDYYGEAEGGDTEARLLIFPRVSQDNMASIRVHHTNKDGSVTDFTVVGKDSSGDGLNDTFYIKGYEKATMNPVLSAAMCSFAGYTLTMKKLSISVMKSIDRENAGTEGYIPIVGEDGKINFDEYGLGDGCDDYCVVTSTDGSEYKVFFGDTCPNGNSFYVRYYSEEEGDRNAVYKLSDDPGVSASLNVEASRSSLLLGDPRTMVYPQLTYHDSMSTYLSVHNFSIMKTDAVAEGSYSQVIAFTYQLLSERNYTIRQTNPYYVTMESGVLSGYQINDYKVDDALQDLYTISGISDNPYSSTSVSNYVKTLELVADVVSDLGLPSMTKYETSKKYVADYNAATAALRERVDWEVANNANLREKLAKYGLDEPTYRVYYDSTVYGGDGGLYPVCPNYFLVSELTDSNVYYVYAPFYQQIVEVGDQYLDMLQWNTLDWVDSSVYAPGVLYCDSVEIAGTDKDGKAVRYLFELDNKITLKSTKSFSFYQQYAVTMTKSNYETTVTVDGEGNKTVSVNINLGYKATATDGTEQELTLSAKNILNLKLNTVRNLCKYYTQGDSFLNKLSESEKKSLETYLKSSPSIKRANNVITVTHSLRADGDEYGYIDEAVYEMSFVYNTDTELLTLRSKQKGQNTYTTVFEEEVFDGFFAKEVRNDGVKPTFTDAMSEKIDSYYASITALNSELTTLRIKTLDATGKVISSTSYDYTENAAQGSDAEKANNYISAFKKFYQNMLYASYEGRADVADTVGGAKLTEQEMSDFIAQGDNCDIRIKITTTLNGDAYEYRMYNYSPTRAFITANGEGQFYILRSRAEKLVTDAVKVTLGDTSIDPTKTYE